MVSIQLPNSESLSAESMDFIKSEIQNAVAASFGDAFRLTSSATDIADKNRDYSEYYLVLTSQIRYLSESWISVTFTGLYNAKTAAHPLHPFYTVNFNPQTNTAIAFSDHYTADSTLYGLFSQNGQALILERAGGTWPEGWGDFSEAVCSGEAFSHGLETGAIGFYRTVDGVGFIIEMPHAFGGPLDVVIPVSALEGQESSETTSLEKHDIYNLGTQTNDSPFNIAIGDNPIDKAFVEEFTVAGTTDEMIGVEVKYIDLWQAELERSIDAYTADLSSEDAQAFLAAQELYLQALEANCAYDSSQVLTNPSMGSAVRYLLPAAKREALRERTIHVKYLHYLLEQTGSEPEAEYDSLKFLD